MLEIPRLRSVDLHPPFTLLAKVPWCSDTGMDADPTILQHLKLVREGLIPAFIIEGAVDHLGQKKWYPDTVRDHFIRRLLGGTKRDRDRIYREDNLSVQKGQEPPHQDEFNGVTAHIQGAVNNESGRRTVEMGFRRTPISGGETFRTFQSVREGTTEGEIWSSHVEKGDITFFNSGLFMPDGTRLAAVHHFTTPDSRGVALADFSRFTCPQS